MKTRTRTLTLVAMAALMVGGALKSGAALADDRLCMPLNGHYSWRLKAHFVIQQMHIPGYTFYAARIVSRPAWDSPLRQLGLRVGDVITRLDGIPVNNYAELNNHVALTYVRYIRQGTDHPMNGSMHIGWGGGYPAGSGITNP